MSEPTLTFAFVIAGAIEVFEFHGFLLIKFMSERPTLGGYYLNHTFLTRKPTLASKFGLVTRQITVGGAGLGESRFLRTDASLAPLRVHACPSMVGTEGQLCQSMKRCCGAQRGEARRQRASQRSQQRRACLKGYGGAPTPPYLDSQWGQELGVHQRQRRHIKRSPQDCLSMLTLIQREN